MSNYIHIALELERGAFSLAADLTLPARGVTVLFGPSGSGKTTLLRCVAGLERAQKVRVQIADALWEDRQTKLFVPVHRRELGYVFQEASLFTHLSVRANLHYGVKRVRQVHAQASAQQKLDEAISLLGIAHLLDRRPDSLSGGERQRVAIARALATCPKILLLDEPLAALDVARRQEVLPWLERLRTELAIPMLYVTHSVEEMSRLADTVVMLEHGRVIAQGAVEEVLGNAGQAGLLGDEAGALITGMLALRDAQWHLARVDFDGGSVWIPDTGIALGQEVRMRLLARDLSLVLAEPHHTSMQNHAQGTIRAITPDRHPAQALVAIACGNTQLLVRVTYRALSELQLTVGARAWVQMKAVARVW